MESSDEKDKIKKSVSAFLGALYASATNLGATGKFPLPRLPRIHVRVALDNAAHDSPLRAGEGPGERSSLLHTNRCVNLDEFPHGFLFLKHACDANGKFLRDAFPPESPNLACIKPRHSPSFLHVEMLVFDREIRRTCRDFPIIRGALRCTFDMFVWRCADFYIVIGSRHQADDPVGITGNQRVEVGFDSLVGIWVHT